MLNFSYIIPLICFWHTITYQVSKYKQLDASNNIISLTHCLLFMVHHNFDYNIDYAVHMSIGYYIYDLIYITSCIYNSRSKDEFTRRYPFIIHHFIALYLLNALTQRVYELFLFEYYDRIYSVAMVFLL